MKPNRFINPRDNDTPIHSSVFAKVSRGKTIGSASAQSFNQRVKIERNRKAVGRYGDSLVARNLVEKEARPKHPAHSSSQHEEPKQATPHQQRHHIRRAAVRPPIVKPQTPPRGFTEPPKRGFNPYK